MAITTVVGHQIDFSNRNKFVTIVGPSENTTHSERQAAFDLARLSVLNGFVVVSGLAREIDTAAHAGALSVSGDFPKTVAVLSTSPDERIYPFDNTHLAEQIVRYGALVHCYKTRAEWIRGVKFGQPQKRLVERDVIQAYLSHAVFAVSDSEIISGGTRWALNYGKHFGARLFRYSPDRKMHDPQYKVESNLIRWNMELNYESAGQELQQGNYDYVPGWL